MSHSVTYSPGDPARNRIRISCAHSEHKPSTGPDRYIVCYDQNSESESEELWTMSQNIRNLIQSSIIEIIHGYKAFVLDL